MRENDWKEKENYDIGCRYYKKYSDEIWNLVVHLK
jgi:hypothetical protein